MSPRRSKALTTALLVELVAVAVLAGFGPEFPRDVAPGTAWHFLGTHAFAVSHAVLGTLVLVQSAALVVVSRARLTGLVVALGVLVAVAAGGAYVFARQPDAALTVMTVGWLVALGGTVAELVALRRHGRRAPVGSGA